MKPIGAIMLCWGALTTAFFVSAARAEAPAGHWDIDNGLTGEAMAKTAKNPEDYRMQMGMMREMSLDFDGSAVTINLAAGMPLGRCRWSASKVDAAVTRINFTLCKDGDGKPADNPPRFGELIGADKLKIDLGQGQGSAVFVRK